MLIKIGAEMRLYVNASRRGFNYNQVVPVLVGTQLGVFWFFLAWLGLTLNDSRQQKNIPLQEKLHTKVP